MSYMIFCSFEVGGFPFRMAETLNRHGVEVFYIYIGPKRLGHDSTAFHYGGRSAKWDLSDGFGKVGPNRKDIVDLLTRIKKKYCIQHCLATGGDAHLLKKAGIQYKYWSYGSDIDQQSFVRVPVSNRPLYKRVLVNPYKLFSERKNARRSIRDATSIMIAPYQLDKLNQICSGKNMFFLPHYFKVVDYQELLHQKAQSKKIICEQIGVERYFFSATRQVWSGRLRDTTDNKGNDIILNSYAIFRKLTGDHPSKLVFVEKGPDVDAAKLLSRSLSIDDSVAWIDEMRREELDRYYQGAEICFGQFGTPVLTYAALEPLANGTISASFLNKNNSLVPFYKEMPPIFSGKDPKEIAEFMVRTLAQKEKYASVSYKAWLWIEDNCSEGKFVKSFIKLFKEDPSI